MKSRIACSLFTTVVIVSLSCNFLTQSLPASVGSGDFSARATSPVSVHLEWKIVTGAPGYSLEARYGTDFFPVADLPGDRTGYEHFVVPGSTDITYRLRAGDEEIGTATVTIPELVTNPLLVQFDEIAAAPKAGAFPTLDPDNPDPSSLFPPGFDPNDPGSFDPSSLLEPVSVTQDVGPEGGTVSMTAPDGVTFTLSLPPGTVKETLPITLVPVQAAEPLPFSGGLLGAVAIDAGLPFGQPGTLTIELPSGAAAAPGLLAVGFFAAEDSHEFMLYPSRSADGRIITMTVDLGGIYGILSASLEDVRAQALRIPSGQGARIAQLAVVMGAGPEGSGPGGEEAIVRQFVEGLLRQVQQIVVRTGPQAAAGTDRTIAWSADFDAAGNQVADLRNALEAASQLWVTYGETYVEVSPNLMAELVTRIRNYLDKVTGECLTLHNTFGQEIADKVMLPPNEMWNLISSIYSDRYGASGQRLLVEVAMGEKSCDFSLILKKSTIVMAASGLTVTSSVRAEKPIQLSLAYTRITEAPYLTGRGAVQYTKLEYKFSDCPPLLFTQYPNSSVRLKIAPIFSNGVVKDFELSVLPPRITSDLGGMGELGDDGCPRNVKVKGRFPDYWQVSFLRMHSGFQFDPGPPWHMDNFGGAITATLEIADRRSGPITEASSLELRIVPRKK